MVRTEATGATAPATQAAVAAGATILELHREAASRRPATSDWRRGSRRSRGRGAAAYRTPPYFPSDVC